MSGTAELLLGVIASALAVMAVVQVGAIVAGYRVAQRVAQIATELETSVKPLLANLNAMSAEALRAASLAAAQVERMDRVFGELATRVEQTLATAQRFVAGPAREGMAVVAGVKAAITMLKGIREASRRRSAVPTAPFEEDEESLFIG